MIPYIVQTLPENSYGHKAIVFATCFERPTDYLFEIQTELQEMGITGTVIFDLLAANGTRYRRFFAVEYDGERFDMSFRVLDGIPTTYLSEVSTKFFTANMDKFDWSLLTAAMRYCIENDIQL